MNGPGQVAGRIPALDWAQWTVVQAFRPLHALIVAPSLLYLAALSAMLFRPPDVQFGWLDRIAFLLLVVVVILRALVLRQPLKVAAPVTWPMAALLLLSLGRLLAEPYDPQDWSVFAAKWAVPFVLYQMAGRVFQDAASLRRFELFGLGVLAYLILIAVLFLFDAKDLIFPRYILDESLGIHADRARGPFLQAVANGVTLNMLGLIALDAFRRRRLPGLLAISFLAGLPLAILATETRAVWLSFAGSVLGALILVPSPRVRRTCVSLILVGGLALLWALTLGDTNALASSRLEERSPLEFRVVMYRTGLEMLLEKPLLGWSTNDVQPELAKRVHDFHQKQFFFHNTYLEIAVEHGVVGLVLYGWMVLDLFRLGSKRGPKLTSPDGALFDEGFRSLWPVLVGVYLLNASFVVMNYQFVNGLLFTIAGVLAAQNRGTDPRLHVFPS